MRSSQSAPALVALLFVATASALSPARLHCLRSRNLELARLAACGEPGSVAHCMEMVADDFTQTDLERCYINAGCDFAEAVIESQWTLDRCDNSGSAPAELRKRHVTVFARQTTEATAATAETATGTSTGTATYSKLTCSTSTTKSTTQCPVVSTGVQKGKTLKEGCFPTQVVYGTCAAGLLCKNDNSGNPSCKVLDNTVYPGGIAVALFFAVAITGSIAWITFLCCKERKQKKRNAARVQAAMDAKMAAKRQPAVQVHDSDNQPLMSYGQPAAAYEAHGPFGDQNRMRALIRDGGVKSSHGSRYLLCSILISGFKGRIKVHGMRHEPTSKQKFKSLLMIVVLVCDRDRPDEVEPESELNRPAAITQSPHNELLSKLRRLTATFLRIADLGGSAVRAGRIRSNGHRVMRFLVAAAPMSRDSLGLEPFSDSCKPADPGSVTGPHATCSRPWHVRVVDVLTKHETKCRIHVSATLRIRLPG